MTMLKGHEFIQIIDISVYVKYDIATAEKKLQSMINGLVSHEIRNPLNSIKIQILRQKFLNEKIDELIKDDKIKSLKLMKHKMRKILIDHMESNINQINSEKILNFLV